MEAIDIGIGAVAFALLGVVGVAVQELTLVQKVIGNDVRGLVGEINASDVRVIDGDNNDDINM